MCPSYGGAMPLSDYADFEHLAFDRRPDGVVVVTLDRPEVLNAANVRMHREMSEVWAVDRRRPRRAGVGGDRGGPRLQRRRGPRHDRGHDRGLRGLARAVARRRRHRRVHAQRRQARGLGHQRRGRGRRTGGGPHGRHQHHGGVGPGVGRTRPVGGGRRRPRRGAVAASVWHGQGQVLPAHRRLRRRARGRAHRARDQMRARRRRARPRRWPSRRAWPPGAPRPCSGPGGS